MLQTVSNVKRQSGISLLELMLSLAIIAVILTMATRFFSQANQSQNLNNAVSMANGIVAAVQNYHTSGGVGEVSVKNLVDANMLPKDFGGNNGDGIGANPWGGDIQIVEDGATNQLIVKFTKVPTGSMDKGLGGSCHMLAARLNKTYNDATCENGTVSFAPIF